MAGDTVVTPPSPGAGRKLDIFANDLSIDGMNTSGNGVARPGLTLGAANQGIAKTIGTYSNQLHKGRHCQKWTSAGAGASDYVSFHTATMNGTFERPLEVLPDDYAVMSQRVILAFGDFPARMGGHEYGVRITNRRVDAGWQYIFGGFTGSGVLFGPVNNNAVRFLARANNNLISVDVDYPVVIAATEWKEYEIRVVSATPSADGFMYGLINRKQVTDKFPIANTNAVGTLPNMLNNGGAGFGIGYRGGWGWHAPTNPGVTMYYSGSQCIMAPNELALD